MVFILIDWRGNNYEVGDTILYPATFGSTAEMAEATVLDIISITPKYPHSPHFKVKVQPSRYAIYGSPPKRPVFITNVQNITKVS